MTDPTPQPGASIEVREMNPGARLVVCEMDTAKRAVLEMTGTGDWRVVGTGMAEADASLLAHGRGELARLRKALDNAQKSLAAFIYGDHREGDPNPGDALAEARAALAGRAAGGEGP